MSIPGCPRFASRTRVAALVLAASLLGPAGCGDDAPTVSRVRFGLAQPFVPFFRLDVTVTNSIGARLAAGLGPACNVVPGVGVGSFVETADGVVQATIPQPIFIVGEEDPSDDDPGDLGIAGSLPPVLAFECLYDTRGLADADSFSPVATAARTFTGQPISPLPEVVVISVDDATPRPTTTTTLSPDALDYSIEMSVTAGTGTLSALQFDVRFVGSGGVWVGSAGSVFCTTLVDVALATYNNRGSGWISAAMIDLEGFDIPGPISRCTFRADPEPAPDDFVVTVIDASTPDAGRPDPFPEMTVTDIAELDDSTPGDLSKR